MPKKPPKNAFFFFMLDVKRKEEARGLRFSNGLAGVSEVASAQWNKLSPEEKIPYEKQAKDAKLAPSGAQGERYTSQGIAFSEIDRVNAAVKLAEENMHKEINQLVKQSYLDNTISTQEYIFVAGNYFCKTHSNLYIPAELAFVKYNASEGYGNKYHVFINPGQLPSGYAFEAVNRTKTVHRLPAPPKAFGEDKYVKIVQNIIQFFGSSSTHKLPPMFTDTDQVPVIKSIIDQLCKESNQDPSIFRVYPIAQLFFVFKGEASKYALDGTGAFFSVHIAQTLIDRDQYDYRANIACSYHEEVDASKFCALSYVIRWSFIISENICPDLGISLIPGQHVPSDMDNHNSQYNDDIDDCISIASAATSISSNFTMNTVYTQWNNDCDSIAASEIANTEKNFPSLGSRKLNRSSVFKTALDSQKEQSFSRFDRSKDVREPLDTSLSFAVGGRGRGCMTPKHREPKLSLGRGRFN